MPDTSTSQATNRHNRTNSAERLHSVLKKIKACTGPFPYRVVPFALGITATTNDVELGWAFARAMVIINKMLDDFELEIESSTMSEDEKTYNLDSKQAVINAVAPVKLAQPWDQFRNSITDAILIKLEGTGVALRRHINEQMVSQEDLQLLRDSVKEALEVISDSSLPNNLKAFVSMHLLRIKTAMDEYEYRGMVGLQEALSGYLGSLVMSSDKIGLHIPELKRTKLADVVTAANAVLTLAHGVAWFWPQIQAGWNGLTGLLGG